MSAALTLWLASTALAQRTPSESERPAKDKTSEQARPAQEPLQDAGAQPSAADEEANRARTFRHLYGIQVDSVRLSALAKSQVEQLQQALQDQGYYTAAVDGVAGKKTRQALRQYYLDQAELAAQDLILPQGASSLGLDEADIERVRGEEAEGQRARDTEIERTRGVDDAKRGPHAPNGADTMREPTRGPTLPMNPEIIEKDSKGKSRTDRAQ